MVFVCSKCEKFYTFFCFAIVIIIFIKHVSTIFIARFRFSCVCTYFLLCQFSYFIEDFEFSIEFVCFCLDIFADTFGIWRAFVTRKLVCARDIAGIRSHAYMPQDKFSKILVRIRQFLQNRDMSPIIGQKLGNTIVDPFGNPAIITLGIFLEKIMNRFPAFEGVRRFVSLYGLFPGAYGK